MGISTTDENWETSSTELAPASPSAALDFFGEEDDDLLGGDDAGLDAEEAIVLQWVNSARGLINLLVENKALELEPDADRHELALGMAPFMAQEPAQASAVSEWLLDADGVVDFFLSDRELHQILKRW
jgi:hypothetical protein